MAIVLFDELADGQNVLGRWMKEAATKSMSCSQPKTISFASCSEIGGRPRDTPGAATRFFVLILPLF